MALARGDQDHGVIVRPAGPGDCGSLVELTLALARYEKSEASAQMTEADLHKALFSPSPVAYALVAQVDGALAGSAIYYFTFSTWTGKPGLFLEDLFVLPEYRRRGVGTKLLAALAGCALSSDCARLEWMVLDWNQPAIDFYRSVGALALDEWTMFRLNGLPLEQLAGRG